MADLSAAMLSRLGVVPSGSYKYGRRVFWHLRWVSSVAQDNRGRGFRLHTYALCAKPVDGAQDNLFETGDPVHVCSACAEKAQRHRALHPR